MNNETQRLELESILSQIYSNDYIYEGPYTMLDFYQVIFLSLNSLNIYVKDVLIGFDYDCLLIQLGKVRIEIKYSDIENLSINFQEASNVF